MGLSGYGHEKFTHSAIEEKNRAERNFSAGWCEPDHEWRKASVCRLSGDCYCGHLIAEARATDECSYASIRNSEACWYLRFGVDVSLVRATGSDVA